MLWDLHRLIIRSLDNQVSIYPLHHSASGFREGHCLGPSAHCTQTGTFLETGYNKIGALRLFAAPETDDPYFR
jgi:hypothetical protein